MAINPEVEKSLETCPTNCNGVNATMMVVKINHTEAEPSGHRIHILYQARIWHSSDDFTQPVVWNTQRKYYIPGM